MNNEPLNIPGEIVLDKTFRKELDSVLQRLKAAPPSRNRALSITHLEDSIMRLGMSLKDLGEIVGTTPVDPLQRARDAYQRYGAVTGFKNFQGNPMPAFSDLGEKIQQAWVAAAGPGGPYPSSYDPNSPKVEPVADGLKL